MVTRSRKSSVSSFDESELENARVGYQTAINLITGVISVIWSIFNAMLVANSIVVAGISLVLGSKTTNANYRIPLSVIGLILCLIWYLIAKRHRDYLAYYILSAREIEEKYFNHSVITLSRGGDFSEGKAVPLNINSKKIMQRMSLWPRLVKGESASYVIIFVFAVIYISLIFIY